jgi:hypothetical protein
VSAKPMGNNLSNGHSLSGSNLSNSNSNINNGIEGGQLMAIVNVAYAFFVVSFKKKKKLFLIRLKSLFSNDQN